MSRSLASLLLLLLLTPGTAAAGTLEIATQPGVEVLWEGVPLATTDAEGLLVVEDVPFGPFELTLRKPGFEELTTEVSVGQGTTRLERRLRALPPPAPRAPLPTRPIVESPPAPPSIRADSPDQAAESGVPPSTPVPTVRLSRGALLAGLAVLAVIAALVLRSRRGGDSPAPPAEAGAPRAPRVTRAQPEVKTGGGFLHELRQRERALDELVDISPADERRTQVPEPEVVDVAWKEID